MTSKVNYLGDLRTSAIHIASDKNIITDAPIDNQGKGEAFSPTDTVATALASCLLTIMELKLVILILISKILQLKLAKIMASNPRRISEIQITVNFTKSYDQRIKKILEKAALACPVSNSLHPDLKQNILFNWPS